jgi:hypothetical protein
VHLDASDGAPWQGEGVDARRASSAPTAAAPRWRQDGLMSPARSTAFELRLIAFYLVPVKMRACSHGRERRMRANTEIVCSGCTCEMEQATRPSSGTDPSERRGEVDMIILLGSRPARSRGVCKMNSATAHAQAGFREQGVRVDGPSGEEATRVCFRPSSLASRALASLAANG